MRSRRDGRSGCRVGEVGAHAASRTRSTARRRTGVARELVGALLLVGELRAAHQQPQLRAVLGQFDRQAAGGGRGRAGGERALDDAVLERLVGQHDHPAADGKGTDGRRDGSCENAEFVVHLDAKRLEDALRRMAGALDRGGGGRDQHVDELARPREGGDLASLDDFARVARGELFLAVLIEDAAQVGLAVLGEDALRRQLAMSHPSACRAGHPASTRSRGRRGRAAATRRRGRTGCPRRGRIPRSSRASGTAS